MLQLHIVFSLKLEILKNRTKLERMILDNENYEKILNQSRKLDNYINIKIREQNKEQKTN